MAYSIDFRQKILEAYLNREGTNQEIAGRFKISISTVKRIGQRFKKTGKIELYLSKIGQSSKIDTASKEFIKKALLSKPDATLEELSDALKKERKIIVTPQAIFYMLKKLNISCKKKSFYAIQRDTDDVKKKEKNLSEK